MKPYSEEDSEIDINKFKHTWSEGDCRSMKFTTHVHVTLHSSGKVVLLPNYVHGTTIGILIGIFDRARLTPTSLHKYVNRYIESYIEFRGMKYPELRTSAGLRKFMESKRITKYKPKVKK